MFFTNSVPHDHENFHAADELCVPKLVGPQPAKPSRTKPTRRNRASRYRRVHDGLDAGPKEVDMSQSIAIAMTVLAAELETAEAALAGNSSDAEHEALYGLAEAARDVIEVWGS
jgi:hypothetical protein